MVRSSSSTPFERRVARSSISPTSPTPSKLLKLFVARRSIADSRSTSARIVAETLLVKSSNKPNSHPEMMALTLHLPTAVVSSHPRMARAQPGLHHLDPQTAQVLNSRPPKLHP